MGGAVALSVVSAHAQRRGATLKRLCACAQGRAGGVRCEGPPRPDGWGEMRCLVGAGPGPGLCVALRCGTGPRSSS